MKQKISLWLLYLTAFFAFFSGWFFIASDYEWIRRNLRFIMNLNAPVVDLLAVAVIFFIILEWFFRQIERPRKLIEQKIPGELKWYLVFICSAAISIYFAFDGNYLSSAWHWLRYIVFSYAAFLVVPYIVAEKENVIRNILGIWFAVGIGIAFYGLASLFVDNAWGQWTRVQPFSLLGFMPLGLNHNQLAEALVAIIPAGVYWTVRLYRNRKRYFLSAGGLTIFMLIICLLTLSRAAWVALAMQGLAAVVFFQDDLLKWAAKNKIIVRVALAAAGILACYMLYFVATSSIVSSSNSARLESTRIVYFYLNRSPFFGFGPGAYTQILADTRSYVMDFGEPLEAHGFIQKIIIEEGFVGFILFIIFLIAFFLHLWNAQRARGSGQFLARVMFVMALGAVVFQLFNTEYFSAVMWMPMGVALAYAKMRMESIL